MARALGVGDVVAATLATTTFEAVTGTPHSAHDDQPLGDGWVNLVRRLVNGEREPSGTSAGE